MQVLLVDARTWLFAAVIIAAGVAGMLVVHSVVFLVLGKIAKRRQKLVLSSFVRSIKGPVRLFLIVAGMMVALPFTALPDRVDSSIAHVLQLALICGIGWTFIAAARFLASLIENRFRMDTSDNLAARRVRTQTQVIERVATTAIVVVTVAVMLMTFPGVRQIGASVLASAGIAGLVLGMAAKSTFSSLIAGLQVAITQPIRLEDAVIVENEWGWIEEIETTYVVIRLWDLRRLIVPLSYFIEHPFQNWTRTTADLLGTAMIYTDYTVPVDEVREELHRVLQETELWDRKGWALQVTDLTENTMQLRALMSASDAGKAFELRCFVRERLVRFLQEKHPGSLPKRRERVEISNWEKALPQNAADARRASPAAEKHPGQNVSAR